MVKIKKKKPIQESLVKMTWDVLVRKQNGQLWRLLIN